MNIKLTIPGASPDQLAAGVHAAQVVFDAAGITPLAAARGAFAREGWDVAGTPVADAELEAAVVWDEAVEAAYAAACDGHPRPAGSNFELVA
jgi:hypothetical protein